MRMMLKEENNLLANVKGEAISWVRKPQREDYKGEQRSVKDMIKQKEEQMWGKKGNSSLQ